MIQSVKKYNADELESLQNYLLELAEKNEARYYEIMVDDLRVVPRTSNVDEFDRFLNYIKPSTQTMRVLIFSKSATSPRHDSYTFYFHEHPAKKEQPVVQQPAPQVLDGLEVDRKISESVSRERERWDASLKEKELTDTKVQLKEAEDYIGKLEEELETFRGKKLLWGNVNLGELASIALEGMVRRNTQLIAKIPGAEGLAGIIEQDNTERGKALPQREDAEVSFSKKPSAADPEREGYIQLLKSLEEVFSQAELDAIMKILAVLAGTPARLKEVTALLGIEITTTPND